MALHKYGPSLVPGPQNNEEQNMDNISLSSQHRTMNTPAYPQPPQQLGEGDGLQTLAGCPIFSFIFKNDQDLFEV